MSNNYLGESLEDKLLRRKLLHLKKTKELSDEIYTLLVLLEKDTLTPQKREVLINFIKFILSEEIVYLHIYKKLFIGRILETKYKQERRNITLKEKDIPENLEILRSFMKKDFKIKVKNDSICCHWKNMEVIFLFESEGFENFENMNHETDFDFQKSFSKTGKRIYQFIF